MIYIYLMLFGIGLIFILLLFKLFFGRSILTKHKYIRVAKYQSDKTLTIEYHKKKNFNLKKEYLINPNHVFNFKGYSSILLSDQVNETINPLDFESKFSANDYRAAISSKLIKETFEGLKVDKFDTTKLLVFLSILTLGAVAFLLYTLL